MRAFSYVRVASANEACAAANNGGDVGGERASRFIAGGTNLLDLMKLEIETPETLVDISRLPLASVDEAEGGLRIGAMVSNSDLAAHPAVRKRYPVLARALLAGASGQLRNKASTGGNLLQRTRCYYFYDGAMACNKRAPGSGCAAIGGFNRIHAVLGGSDHCIATHPSDMAVAMRALDARVNLQQADGSTRSIALDELYRLPADAPHRETSPQSGRTHHAHRPTPSSPWPPRLSQGPRPRLVRLCAGVGRGDRGGRRRPHLECSTGLRRPGAHAVARRGGRRHVDRPGTEARPVRERCGQPVAGCERSRPQRLQDAAGEAHPGRLPGAADAKGRE